MLERSPVFCKQFILPVSLCFAVMSVTQVYWWRTHSCNEDHQSCSCAAASCSDLTVPVSPSGQVSLVAAAAQAGGAAVA